MTESPLLDKAYALRREGKFKESYDTLRRVAEVASDPMERVSALIGGITDLLSLRDSELAKTQLETIKNILAESNPSETLDQDQYLRLNLEVELQEALIAVAETVSEEKTREALAAFNSLIKRHESSLEAPFLKDIKETIYIERAFILADLGSCAEALPVLQKMEAFYPENAAVSFYLGYCQWSTKNHDAARKTLEKAIALGLSGNFEFRAHWALGGSLCETGDYGHARVELERARTLASPSDLAYSQIFQWLEFCYKQLGMAEEATHYARLSKPTK